MSGTSRNNHRKESNMTINFPNFGRNLVALLATVLIGFTFIGAATGPAMVTGHANSDIVA
jgi:hypothetical protein